MERLVVIRSIRTGDEVECQKIVFDSTMSTVRASFKAALTREITLQIMVVLFAVMFVFFGLAPTLCFSAIPITFGVLYLVIYAAHYFKAKTINSDMLDISANYLAAHKSGFWVAEAYEPRGCDLDSLPVRVIKEESWIQPAGDVRRRIVGTTAIVRSSQEETGAWMRRVAVISEYQRHGVASRLIDEAISFSRRKGYEHIVLVTTECHEGARVLYERSGFELRQLYHKQIFANIAQILMYEFVYSLDRSNA